MVGRFVFMTGGFPALGSMVGGFVFMTGGSIVGGFLALISMT
jgi:hypothetical protein